MKLSTADEMLFSTVRLSAFSGATHIGSGTGFFWQIEFDDKLMLLLVTNRHVIANCNHIELSAHRANPANIDEPSGEFIHMGMNLLPEGTVEHPDPNVDLVMLGISELYDRAANAGTPIFIRTLAASNIPTPNDIETFDVIETVFMVGCPNGLFDSVNNFPIVRQGITATAIRRDYEGRQEFLVDMACFPGSSGSPVFINQTGFTDWSTGTTRLGASRFFLVGVLWGGPVVTNQGTIVFGAQPRIEVATMMHLGQVIRSTALLALNEEVIARRRKLLIRAVDR